MSLTKTAQENIKNKKEQSTKELSAKLKEQETKEMQACEKEIAAVLAKYNCAMISEMILSSNPQRISSRIAIIKKA